MNVLLTCVGRRNFLAKCFREALGRRGLVFAADANPTAPALQEVDRSFVVPRVDHPDYIEELLDLCVHNEVGLLISLNDLELPRIAGRRESFTAAGVIPVVSSPEVVDTCFDKWKTVEFLEKCGLGSPKTFLSLEEARAAVSARVVSFPLVVKPRWGSGSIAVSIVEDDEELDLAYRLTKKNLARSVLADVSLSDPEHDLIIQEKLEGWECGLDVVNDLSGKYVCTFARRKLSMRAGSTDKAMTIKTDALDRLGSRIGQSLGHVGNLDCDVFLTEEGCRVLEMNPRFGGGYPFCHVAGANLPAALIAWANTEEADPSWLAVKPLVVSSKCDRLVVQKYRVPAARASGAVVESQEDHPLLSQAA